MTHSRVRVLQNVPEYTSTRIHRPCTSAPCLIYVPEYTSTRIHRPCTSAPCLIYVPEYTSTRIHRPCTSAPCLIYDMVHDLQSSVSVVPLLSQLFDSFLLSSSGSAAGFHWYRSVATVSQLFVSISAIFTSCLHVSL